MKSKVTAEIIRAKLKDMNLGLGYEIGSFKSFKDKIEFFCKYHGSFMASPLTVIKVHTCPECATVKKK